MAYYNWRVEISLNKGGKITFRSDKSLLFATTKVGFHKLYIHNIILINCAKWHCMATLFWRSSQDLPTTLSVILNWKRDIWLIFTWSLSLGYCSSASEFHFLVYFRDIRIESMNAVFSVFMSARSTMALWNCRYLIPAASNKSNKNAWKKRKARHLITVKL